MSLDTSPVPELSGQQRRCHLLLMLYTPEPELQLETLSRINGVAPPITRQDIAEVASEIQRFHHLEIAVDPDHGYQLRGSVLDQRLCLIHWLRRALRCSPRFVEGDFAPRLRQALATDASPASALTEAIDACEPLLSRHFDARDRQFLQHYLLYYAWQNRLQQHPRFDAVQRDWLRKKPEQQAAAWLHQACNRLFNQPPQADERDFLALTFTMLKNHSYHSNDSAQERRLMVAIDSMVERFQQLSGMAFSSKAELVSQLFAHLAPALERFLRGAHQPRVFAHHFFQDRKSVV